MKAIPVELLYDTFLLPSPPSVLHIILHGGSFGISLTNQNEREEKVGSLEGRPFLIFVSVPCRWRGGENSPVGFHSRSAGQDCTARDSGDAAVPGEQVHVIPQSASPAHSRTTSAASRYCTDSPPDLQAGRPWVVLSSWPEGLSGAHSFNYLRNSVYNGLFFVLQIIYLRKLCNWSGSQLHPAGLLKECAVPNKLNCVSA